MVSSLLCALSWWTAQLGPYALLVVVYLAAALLALRLAQFTRRVDDLHARHEQRMARLRWWRAE